MKTNARTKKVLKFTGHSWEEFIDAKKNYPRGPFQIKDMAHHVLNEREQEVLRLTRTNTLTAVGKHLCLSRNRVYQIKHIALRKLRMWYSA